jgi:4-amino-4-deoxy-L-arabinose transferase-like glycosyltransferase
MKILTKYKYEILAAISLVALYFITRLIILGNFPIFTDEAIYVRWSQIASNDATWRFISLTDGKQPMLIWAAMLLVKVINDPLIATRMVSVLAGFFTLIGLWLLTYELFRNRLTAFLSSILYICYPFAVVYDRLALYDSTVTAFAVWAILFSVLLVRRIRLDIALILGFILGGGLLTKSSAIFSVYLLPFTLLLFDFKKKNWKTNLIKWVILAAVAAGVAEVIYNSLRLSPFFHIIREKNTIFVYPFGEWIKHPFTFFIGNLKGLSNWLYTYLTPFYLALIVVALITIKKFTKEKLLLFAYFVLPFIALALFGKVIFPRFIYFMSIYLIPLAAVGLLEIINFANNFFKKRKLQSIAFPILIILLFLIYPAKVSLDFIFNPANAKIADADKRQYITEWPAGGGVKESIKYFKEQAKKGPIFIGTEGTFGLMPAGLDIYLGNNKNITTKGYWPVGEEVPKEVLENAKKMPTYFIFYQPCPSCEYSGDAPDTWPVTLISKFKKDENVYYSVYKINN